MYNIQELLKIMVEEGASDQHIALELLKKKGFDISLVEDAINVCEILKKIDVKDSDEANEVDKCVINNESANTDESVTNNESVDADESGTNNESADGGELGTTKESADDGESGTNNESADAGEL